VSECESVSESVSGSERESGSVGSECVSGSESGSVSSESVSKSECK